MDVNNSMTKMYSNKPIVNDKDPEVKLDPTIANWNKRVEMLEAKVNQMAERQNQIIEALKLNSRQLRRANTDITNITTVLRNR